MRKLVICLTVLTLLLSVVKAGNDESVNVNNRNTKPYFSRDYSGRGAYIVVEPSMSMELYTPVPGYRVAPGAIAEFYWNAKLMAGYRFSNYFALGGGLGIAKDGFGAFVDIRSYLLKGPITPYIGLQCGLYFGQGLMLEPKVGVKFQIIDLLGISAFCGYQPMIPDVSFIENRISVGIGCHIDFWKKVKPSKY